MPFTTLVDSANETLDRLPDQCPQCHSAIHPRVMAGTKTRPSDDVTSEVHLAVQCPREDCRRVFLGIYSHNRGGPWILKGVAPRTFRMPSLPEEAVELSPLFGKAYTQAAHAETLAFNEIAGLGYRKALEYLVKDYAIHTAPAAVEDIKKRPLAQCIREYIADPDVKRCAERAAWLGNDEAHYVRKWEDRDIKDLKLLLDLTANWIRSRILTERYFAEMQ